MNRVQYPHTISAVLAILSATVLVFVVLLQASEAQNVTRENRTEENKTDSSTPYVADELLVTLEKETSGQAISKLSGDVEAETVPVAPDLDVELFEFPNILEESSEEQREKSLEEVKKELERDQRVEDVGYNYVIYPRFAPNDKLYDRQYGPQKLRAPRAWDSALGKDIRIGIIDTGIRTGHPDLRGKVVAQRDFYNGDGTTEDDKAEDSGRHGTRVAGIVAAKTDNRKGIAGICPGCDLVVGKFMGPNGGSLADSLKAINFAVDNGAKVLNLSYGYVGKNSPQEEEVINSAWNQGVFISASVYEGFPPGYYGKQNDWPAAYKRVMAVSTTNRYDKRASFANYGSYIDIVAPGVNILSTNSFGSYSYSYGTSFSAPHVSGVAGLLAGKGFSNEEIRKRIESSAVDLGKKGKDPYYGYGRIDALAAVKGKTASELRRCTIKGTRGTDILGGTARADVICGFGGNDIISGRGGNDTIYGGGGNDILNGNSGGDRIIGATGKDVMNGGTGIDRLYGRGGRDVLNIRDGRGGDLANGGADRDVCSADPRDKVTRCP